MTIILSPEDFKDRYRQTEKAADASGLVITVGRLKVSQKQRIYGMTIDWEGSYEVKEPDGTIVEIPRRAQPMLAAMVREIDGHPHPFPRNRAELDSLMDNLDDEGFTAIMEANSRLNGRLPIVEGEDEISDNERAKN